MEKPSEGIHAKLGRRGRAGILNRGTFTSQDRKEKNRIEYSYNIMEQSKIKQNLIEQNGT